MLTKSPIPQPNLLRGHLPAFARNPLTFLDLCAEDDRPIIPLRLGPKQAYLLKYPADIESVLVQQSDKFQKGPGLRNNRQVLGNGLLTSEGDFWHRQRRLMMPGFHQEKIAGYATNATDAISKRLESWVDGQIIDIHSEMMSVTLEIVARNLFGFDTSQVSETVGKSLHLMMAQFQRGMAHPLWTLLMRRLPTPQSYRLRQAIQQLDATVNQIIAQRRHNNDDREDLLSMLLEMKDEDGIGMSDRQIRDEVMTLFIAGHETVATTMSWTWLLLAQHPTVFEALKQEIKTVLGDRLPSFADLRQLAYATAIIKESMRVIPPVWMMARSAIAPCQIGDRIIKPGNLVLMSQWLLHKDSRYWTNSQMFDPQRWLNGVEKTLPKCVYFPFGAGSRICIGQSFAMMEAVILLVAIAQRFELKLVENQLVVMQPAVTLRPQNSLLMQVNSCL
jgi:cytochrome P450